MLLKRITMLIFISSILLCIGCNGEKAERGSSEILISSAVSLTEALEEIKEFYEKEHPYQLIFNLGGSGSLAQQIQQGAPVDVFISANQDWMDTLEQEELIDSETRIDLTGNRIVLITGKTSPLVYESLQEISAEDVDQLAIGNPESVPAGKYAEDILQHIQKWDEFKDKLVYAKDVRQVLAYVESGNAELGFVYLSDALTSDQIKILVEIDSAMHDPIVYPAARTMGASNRQGAADFLQFMESEAAQEILEKHGFGR